MEANYFAADLLMKEEWFCDFTARKDLDMKLISNTVDYFKTSLTSASIRYSHIGKIPCAIIFSQNGKIKWKSISEGSKFKNIQLNENVNKLSYVSDFFLCDSKEAGKKRIPLEAWFLHDWNYQDGIYLIEENIYMTNYNSVLTLLREE